MQVQKNADKKEKRTGIRRVLPWVLVLLVINIILFFYSRKDSAPKPITWQQFYSEMLLAHDVERLEVLNKEQVFVYIKRDSLGKHRYDDTRLIKNKLDLIGPQYVFTIGSIDAFEQRLDQAEASVPAAQKLKVYYENKSTSWFSNLFWVLPALLLLYFYVSARRFSFMGKSSNDAIEFSKSHAEEYGETRQSPVSFKDVAGYEEAKIEVMEIVEFLKHPETFTKLGAKIPKGVLLVGPPGTGKTLMAKAVAGEAAVPFFSLSGSEFIELFVGVGASRVRDLFNKAKEKAPSIVFIDEIDTIGRVRGKAVSIQANDERESTLNQLLAEMDGFDANTGVIVMGATNRADILDAALLRAGRFDRHIYLELPNKEERDAIFKVHLKPLLLDEQVKSEDLASQTPGFSGADIANVCNEAALIAARQKEPCITKEDFSNALERVVSGIEKKTKIITNAEKHVIAYHEAGHAVVGWMLEHVDPLVKVSIIPRGKSLGGAWYAPEERQIVTRAQLTDQLCATLGGRAAEQVIFNEVSTGALDDLEKVTKQAYSMVAKFGLSDRLGNLSFYDSTGMYDNSFQRPYSESTALLIDNEVQRIISEAFERAKLILQEHKDQLITLSELLLKKEVIYKDEIETILGKRLHKIAAA